ncbi:hypothetical protein [Pseudonocardia sp. NPDC049635]|uniref:hypothetical protein n=1 Tax=Pseudonocardia sp. NPDC049635 TaxID=3155506 RepID=UPI0033E2DE65
MSGPGYAARVRAAWAAVREVRDAYEVDQRALRARARAVLDGHGRRLTHERDGDVVGERTARLSEMVDESLAGLRSAVWGRRVDSAALIARARELSATAASAYRLDPITASDGDRSAGPDSEQTDTAGNEPGGATATDQGAEDTGLAGPVEDTPPERPRAAAAERDGVEPVVASWPPWQDAQRMRDPDLDVVEAVLEEVTATDPERWRREFAQADELTEIAENVADERDRPQPHDPTRDIPGTDFAADSDGPDDVGPGVGDQGDTDGSGDDSGDDGVRSLGEVPDPLEQARQALAAVRLDLTDNDDTAERPGGVWRDTGADDGQEDQQ